MSRDVALTWLKLADADLQWGRDSFQQGHYPQVCFIAQQVGEKALKAVAHRRDFAIVRGHSIVSLAEKLELNGELLAAGRRLDLYYIAPRYPDALPDHGDPRAHFDRDMAAEALVFAESILRRARSEIEHG
ncbi:MAG: HEPN domain-containing protein [Leptospirales bacterium]|nr:HEPN domain-containing protein [Leptospirales bacterium]